MKYPQVQPGGDGCADIGKVFETIPGASAGLKARAFMSPFRGGGENADPDRAEKF
jgi:hypothetical protein